MTGESGLLSETCHGYSGAHSDELTTCMEKMCLGLRVIPSLPALIPILTYSFTLFQGNSGNGEIEESLSYGSTTS